MNVISYSRFAARSVSFISFARFFFSDKYLYARVLLSCMYVCLLHTTDSTQYSADKDREKERLGENVSGNDNAGAEFIHENTDLHVVEDSM